jgi:hypothetical protein
LGRRVLKKKWNKIGRKKKEKQGEGGRIELGK